MWFLPLLLYSALTEPLSAQGETRLILSKGSNPCNGYIGIYHEGKLGFVGHKIWNKNIEKVVCRSTHCGEPVNDATETAVHWDISNVWLNELNCTGNEAHLWDCGHPGWGRSFFNKGTLKKIECSYEIKMSLDGFRCAGAVQYSTDKGETNSGYICAENWEQKEADLLCKSLECGTSKEIPKQPWMDWESFTKSNKKTINCSGINDVTNPWQCAQEVTQCKNPASVICTGFERLQLKGSPSNVCSGQLQREENGSWKAVKESSKPTPDKWCQHMHCGSYVSHSQKNSIQLTCTDNVTVVLKDGEKNSRCYGEVHIAVNDLIHPVCDTAWTDANAEVVCRELNCGTVIPSVIRSSRQTERPDVWMDYVKCSGSESSLWHCRAKRAKKAFKCSSTAYVVCAESVTVGLMDGPGRCAGRVEIQYEGQMRSASTEGWTETNSDTVCRQLNCGSNKKSISPNTNSDKFSQGSGGLLTVKCTTSTGKISQCVISEGARNNPTKELAVGVTCDEHKVVFLKGNKSCSGMVGIEHKNNNYWLSGSKETWNQEAAYAVCQQTHCGKAMATGSSSRANEMKVWGESYSCSPNASSLFDCNKTVLPSNHSDSIATVECSGDITVNLTKDCMGTVNVCVDGRCGGVCDDAWTEQMSVMLCKDLGCGDKVLKANNKPARNTVMFKSLHSTQETTHLNQCNLVLNNGSGTCTPAYVVCSGSVKSRFHPSRDKCSGNVEALYEDKWLPVCAETLQDTQTQKTICEELDCGRAVSQIEYFGPKSGKRRTVSEIKCFENSTSLRACDVSSEEKVCDAGGLQCSDWSKMVLKLAMPEGGACSGAVFVDWREELSAVSFEDWKNTEGDRLCQDLGCGKVKGFSSKSTVTTNWTVSFTCKMDPKNIWECEKEKVPSQQSSEQKQLFLECLDEPKVALSDTCHGDLSINGTEVCASNWKKKYSDMICQDQTQTCGNSIDGSFIRKTTSPAQEYFHVSCEDKHYGLGQCKRFKGKCEKEELVSVYCVGNVNFNTTEKCGGQIEVNYRKQWEKVCPLTSDKFGIMLCAKLGCGGLSNIKTIKKDKKVSLYTALDCTKEHRDIKYCVKQHRCDDVQPAEIYCTNYVAPSVEPKVERKQSIVPIILGVGFVLILLILIIILIRICVVKKAKNASLRMSRKEMAFESGDYDDVTSKANEMEDLNRGRFRSESQVITENDARSTSSFPYDDIDDVAQSLTSQAATAGASGDNYINEGAANQSADGVTYEVDDPQENYDDIEAGPEITQTEAEVHYSPEATPECGAAAPLGLVQGDEDYLVPDQDR